MGMQPTWITPPPVSTLKFGADLVDCFSHIVGVNAGLRETVHHARVLAKVDTALLLQGETGVGKQVLARAIHDAGNYREAPFVSMSCAGLPRELMGTELLNRIEAADGGTLFLDEIAEMALDVQPRFLRVLETGQLYSLGSSTPRTVRFRLIAASNRDLRAEVNSTRFRMDLFLRVSVTSIHIPALRKRKEDLPALVERFARYVAERYGMTAKRFTPEVLAAFTRYDWPGNLRELRNAVEAMTLLADGELVGFSALPPELATRMDLRAEALESGSAEPSVRSYLGLDQVEREAIGAAIRMRRGNLTYVARDLNISRSTLYLKMKKYALESVLTEVRLGR